MISWIHVFHSIAFSICVFVSTIALQRHVSYFATSLFLGFSFPFTSALYFFPFAHYSCPSLSCSLYFINIILSIFISNFHSWFFIKTAHLPNLFSQDLEWKAHFSWEVNDVDQLLGFFLFLISAISTFFQSPPPKKLDPRNQVQLCQVCWEQMKITQTVHTLS